MYGPIARLAGASRNCQSILATLSFSRGTAARLLSLCALGLLGAGSLNAQSAAAPDRVRGFFCNEKADSVGFLMQQALGENEEMAANAVNKSIGKFSCAYYLPAEAIYTGEHTVMRDGLVFKLHSYVFLPEKVERWSGSVLGSLQPSANAKHDV
jgi:hypothetical protein